mmetsp:Transcript_7952/g.11785  ORF Transcript_7952/g.11785 Transcript_7952/m.11785 type:complete len:472 (-) Transcript_7952:49-1464(-)
MSADLIGSVLQAAGSAVGKVFLIGMVGYLSVLYPKENPLMPCEMVGRISRITFNLLTLPLIFSTIASTVSLDTLSYLWFVVVGGFVILFLSYFIATALERLPFFRIENRVDFQALRIAATFPNIVALPVLIFPALCEYEVVYDAFSELDEGASVDEKYKDCVEQSNTMIFTYFFSWSLVFWTFGNQVLVSAGETKQKQNGIALEDVAASSEDNAPETWQDGLVNGLRNVFTSTGFIAMFIGFITASIIPLQEALYEPSGALRFMGSAIESLANASPPLSTMVVAASLVVNSPNVRTVRDLLESSRHTGMGGSDDASYSVDEGDRDTHEQVTADVLPERQTTMRRLRSNITRSSAAALSTVRSPSFRLYAWFITSRLLITPAVVCALLVGLDCSGFLADINPLSKLVLLLNAALPGALIVVVVTKTRELKETASVLAKVYLPTYMLSILTISFWASVGLFISIPDSGGSSFC